MQDPNSNVQEIYNKFRVEGGNDIALQDVFMFYREMFENSEFTLYEEYKDEQALF